MLDREYTTLKDDREALRSSILPDGEPGIYLPVNIERLIWNIKESQGFRRRTDLRPDFVIK